MTHETQSILIGFGILILWFLAILWLTVRRYWRHLRGAPAHALAALPDTARFLHPERTGGWYGVLDVAAWTWIACLVVGNGLALRDALASGLEYHIEGPIFFAVVLALLGLEGMRIGCTIADPERFKLSEETKRRIAKARRKEWEEFWEEEEEEWYWYHSPANRLYRGP
jgi:hypothetical protein